MSFVLTLISDGPGGGLTPAHAAEARARLGAHGASPAPPSWLAPGEACDIPFDAPSTLMTARQGILDDIVSGCGGDPVDAVLQREDNRRKKLLIADMDSTMIAQECLDELADFVGVKAQVAAITQRTMAGELQFEPSLRERVALLNGLEVHALQRAYDERITLTPGGAQLVATMKKFGAHTCLVSGGFSFFVERIGARLGFHETASNVLLAENGTLTGQVREPILGRAAKLEKLEALIASLGIDAEQALALGDGANDLAMIERAGLGVAFHPHAILAAHADAVIRHSTLKAVLYIQGYRADEIVAA